MKAGIYKRRDNGKHIYVAKDRSIRAHQLTDCHPLDARLRMVNCSEKEQVVSFQSMDHELDKVFADRVADVPNGMTQHDQALQHYLDSLPKDDIYKQAASRIYTPGREPVPRGEVAAPTEAEVQERLVGRHPALGVGYGPDAMLQSAQTVREVNAGVPPHVASQAVDKFRSLNPEWAKQLPVKDAWKGDFTDVPKVDMVKIDAARLEVQLAVAATEATMLEPYLEIAEQRGFISRVQDEIVIHDEHRYREFMLKVGETIAKHKPEVRFVAGGYDLGYKIGDVAMPVGERTVQGPPMPKSMKRHGAVGVVAYTDWEKRMLRSIQEGDIRLIGKQSKRKHRKAGHTVFWFKPLRSWVWAVQ